MAKVILQGGGPGVVIIVRAPESNAVTKAMDVDREELLLPEGLYLLEASYPDGRLHRVQLRLKSEDERTVVIPPSIEASARPAVRSAPTEPWPHAWLLRRLEGEATVSRPEESWTSSLKGFAPQHLVVGPGQPLMPEEANVGSYIASLGAARFTGDVEVSMGSVGGRFSMHQGRMNEVALGGRADVSAGEAFEELIRPPVAEVSMRVLRKGWFVSCWVWNGYQWRVQPLEFSDGDSLRAGPAGRTMLLQVTSPQRSEFVAFSAGLPEPKLVIDDEGRVRLDFHGSAHALLGFLAVGNQRAAAIHAQNLIQRQDDSAPLAVARGYYLLDAPEDEQPPSRWWVLLAHEQGLPDGAILEGWRALRKEQPDTALRWFLEAERRGVPLFTRGLRLLLNGLWSFGTRSAEAQAAAARLKPYADSARRASVVTTFGGTSPDNPCRMETPVTAPPGALSVEYDRLASGLDILTTRRELYR